VRGECLHERRHALLGLGRITAAGKLSQGLHRGVRRGVELLMHRLVLFRAIGQDIDHPAWLSEHDLGEELLAPRCRDIGADRTDRVIGSNRGSGP
jgi:hypothetical protein